MFVDQIKSALKHAALPRQTWRGIATARTLDELMKAMDEQVTENEIEFRTLARDLERLEALEVHAEARLREEVRGARSRQAARWRLEQLRRHLDTLESRLRIYHSNIELHLTLIGKLQEMEAMEMRGIDAAEIDAITVDFQTEVMRFRNAHQVPEDDRDASSHTRRREGLERRSAWHRLEALTATEKNAAADGRKLLQPLRSDNREEDTSGNHPENLQGERGDASGPQARSPERRAATS